MARVRSFLSSLTLYLCFSSSSGGPLLMSNGDLDKVAVENHILHIEETVADLKTQSQAQEQKQAAVLSSVLSKLTSTTDELSILKTDFDDLEAKHNSSLLELTLVNDQLTTNRNELTIVKSDLKALRADYDSISDELTTAKSYLNATSQKLDHANEALRIQNATIETIEEVVKETTDNISGIRQSLNSVSANITSSIRGMVVVAFSATLQDNVKLTDGQILKYKRVLLNIGDAYNTTTGIFTCPHSGIYAFQMHALAEKNERIILQMFRNNNTIVSLYAKGESRTYDGNSNSVILHVIEGDHLSVRSKLNSDVHDLSDRWFTSFSGYLIALDIKDYIRNYLN